MKLDILQTGTINMMSANKQGIVCEKLLTASKAINTAVVSINTKQKSLAFALYTVKNESLWQQGKGWKSYEAYAKEWGFSKSDASRYAAVGARLTMNAEGKLVSKWAKKTVDFSYAALVELLPVDDEQVDAWLEDGTLSLNATQAACRKAKAVLKKATEEATTEEATEEEAAESAAEEATTEKKATVSGSSVMAYREAMRKLIELAGNDQTLLAAIHEVGQTVDAMFNAAVKADKIEKVNAA